MARVRPSPSLCRQRRQIVASEFDKAEILLVEDNATDAELCMRALGKLRLTDELVWVKDGAEALDFLFRRDRYASRDERETLKVILLDLRLPKISGLEVLRLVKADSRTGAFTGGRIHVLDRGPRRR